MCNKIQNELGGRNTNLLGWTWSASQRKWWGTPEMVRTSTAKAHSELPGARLIPQVPPLQTGGAQWKLLYRGWSTKCRLNSLDSGDQGIIGLAVYKDNNDYFNPSQGPWATGGALLLFFEGSIIIKRYILSLCFPPTLSHLFLWFWSLLSFLCSSTSECKELSEACW